MKAYDRNNGHLPNSVDDLIPKYLSSRPSDQTIIAAGRFFFMTADEHQITYDFTPGAEGWSIRGPSARGPIPFPAVSLGPSTRPK